MNINLWKPLKFENFSKEHHFSVCFFCVYLCFCVLLYKIYDCMFFLINAHICLCSSVECSVLCMRTLLKLLHHHIVYKDVYREVGLIEVMVTCLQRYAALLKDSNSGMAGCGKCCMTDDDDDIVFDLLISTAVVSVRDNVIIVLTAVMSLDHLLIHRVRNDVSSICLQKMHLI